MFGDQNFEDHMGKSGTGGGTLETADRNLWAIIVVEPCMLTRPTAEEVEKEEEDQLWSHLHFRRRPLSILSSDAKHGIPQATELKFCYRRHRTLLYLQNLVLKW